MAEVVYRPIGVIRTPFRSLEQMPIQPRWAEGIRGTVEVLPEYGEGLAYLEGFSHVILLYHLHLSKPASLRVVPFLDTKERGVFATRAPARPNPIGLSVVRLLGVSDRALDVEGVDILDCTPLLDIKPYVPAFDSVEEFSIGWLAAGGRDREDPRSDGRFAASGSSEDEEGG